MLFRSPNSRDFRVAVSPQSVKVSVIRGEIRDSARVFRDILPALHSPSSCPANAVFVPGRKDFQTIASCSFWPFPAKVCDSDASDSVKSRFFPREPRTKFAPVRRLPPKLSCSTAGTVCLSRAVCSIGPVFSVPENPYVGHSDGKCSQRNQASNL